jgi:hypothetical protein
MKIFTLLMAPLLLTVTGSQPEKPDLGKFPAAVISNGEVTMKIYLPDRDDGLYRATRFDWSGVIGSVQYRGHEFFGYWKETHDPTFHEDLSGPVEGFIEPGLGYADARPGEGFIRIGIGILEKEDETEYNWRKTYRILDHGTWSVDPGKDRISFTHSIQSDFGYGYEYMKTIQLRKDGFYIRHTLINTGTKPIETDQFNHNFFMIDGERSGRAFEISFPWRITTPDDLKGLVEIRDSVLCFVEDLAGNSIFLNLEGFSGEVKDHRVTVFNKSSGAGVTYTVDQPLYRMAFWACETTLSPENFIWISVPPGEEKTWVSEYTLFTLDSDDSVER